MTEFQVIPKNLLSDFLTLVSIDSPSKNERGVADWLTEEFKSLGCDVEEDDSGKKVGGNTGNLFVKLPGNQPEKKSLMFSAHMDTVLPAEGVEPVVEDGIIRSKGETVLGSDDKAGLAVILNLVRMARSQPELPRCDLEFSIHVCEEIGLLGAKNIDVKKFKAIAGFILDDHDPKSATVGSPSAVRLDYKISGRAAHAGVEPEKGISALQVMSEAISKMNIGRIDEETTANIGVVSGGSASNVVMEQVSMKAEARSHDTAKLEKQVAHMEKCFKTACDNWRQVEDSIPHFEVIRTDDYKAVRFSDADFPVQLFIAAGKRLGWSVTTKIGGGGTDGSILTHKGIPSIVIGVGMQDIHSTKEWIRISDLEDAARLAGSIVSTHSEGLV
ncbi:M20/M25/M40 family metallo-hydrolase [Calditrichota bacterium]